MEKKEKLSTPNWILEGFDSEEDYNKTKGIKKLKKGDKMFKVRRCPECDSDDVGVVLGGEEGKGSKGWNCHKCNWSGKDIKENELSEEDFMKYLDEKGEDVS